MHRKIHQQLLRRQRFVVGAVLLGILLFVLWARARQIPVPVIVGSSVAGVIGALITASYYYKWPWTGLTDAAYPKVDGVEFQRGKTLWDWLQLLIIPSVLAGAALLFNAQSTQTQLEITTDNQREAALQAYIDNMSELLLDGRLRTSEEGSEIRSVARTRTLSTLRQLDGTRKGQVLQFLHESRLIRSPDMIIVLAGADLRDTNLEGADLRGVDLSEADLRGAKFFGAKLRGAKLRGADLSEADLQWADLSEANLTGARLAGADLQWAGIFKADLSMTSIQRANLQEAQLSETDLRGADLQEANLKDAVITLEQLTHAQFLTDAIMPDGSIHP